MDEIDMDDDDGCWGACGDCERTMCEVCLNQTTCAVCKEKNGIGDYETLCAENMACCEHCVETCEDCGDDFSCHKCCLAEHLKTCSNKSRAQRKPSAAEETIKTTRSELQNAKFQLADIQSRIGSLESQLTEAEQSKVAAEEELKAETETENPSSKQEVENE
jgi:serine phosphatase RsbU (regulator of sigma subunit)